MTTLARDIPRQRVFISYAAKDERLKTQLKAKSTTPVKRFLEFYEHGAQLSAEELKELVYWAPSNLREGRSLPAQIKDAVSAATVMFAFVSRQYFRSQWCFEEWQLFMGLMESEPKIERILVPVQVGEVDPEKLDPLEGLTPSVFRAWVKSVCSDQGQVWFAATPRELTRYDQEDRLEEAMAQTIANVNEHIARSAGTETRRASRENLVTITTPISDGTLNSADILAELTSHEGNTKYLRKPVCLIYAGGTVGMVAKPGAGLEHVDYAMSSDTEGLAAPIEATVAALPFDVHLFRLEDTIDSSNVKASDWMGLARLLDEQMDNYQGFVILHGTNTLAYTASALSFLLEGRIKKPVVLTGSEIPLTAVNTDAVHNIENALRAAAPDAYGGPIAVPEVCVYWSNSLFRGNRVAKKVASDRASGFHTPNMPTPLATLANDRLDVNHPAVIERQQAGDGVTRTFRLRDIARDDIRVAILFIHPDMEFDKIDAQLDPAPAGLILLSYGPGNVPDDPRFLKLIKRLIDQKTMVANVTQCPYGRVELKVVRN